LILGKATIRRQVACPWNSQVIGHPSEIARVGFVLPKSRPRLHERARYNHK
jgi:hypothetical protein